MIIHPELMERGRLDFAFTHTGGCRGLAAMLTGDPESNFAGLSDVCHRCGGSSTQALVDQFRLNHALGKVLRQFSESTQGEFLGLATLVGFFACEYKGIFAHFKSEMSGKTFTGKARAYANAAVFSVA